MSPDIRHITSPGQAAKLKKEGYIFFCTIAGQGEQILSVTAWRYGQGSFQVQIDATSYDWKTPVKFWAQPGQQATLW